MNVIRINCSQQTGVPGVHTQYIYQYQKSFHHFTTHVLHM